MPDTDIPVPAVSNSQLREALKNDNPTKEKCRSKHLRNVFTTGQVARICQVAPRTVSKWVDTGKIGGYRIPGSEDRRIPRIALMRFIKENNIDTSWLQHMPWDTVSLVGVSELLRSYVTSALTESEGYRVRYSPDLMEAAIVAGEFRPDLVVIDLCLPDATHLSRSLERSKVACLALTNEDDTMPDTCLERGFVSWLPKPVPPRALVLRIKDLLSQ